MFLRKIIFFAVLLLTWWVSTALEIADLADFFNSTYIRREVPEWNHATKAFNSIEFSPSWDLYKAHHVCIQKGSEGLFVGLHGSPRDWKEQEEDKILKHFMVSEKEWNALKHTSDVKRNLMETYKARRMDLSTQAIKRIVYLDEGTFFFNCEQNSEDVKAHGDWAVKQGVLYELAMYLKVNKGSNNKPFKYDWPHPFKHLFMNRCSDPALADWNFGLPIMEIVKLRTDLEGLTKDGYTNYLRSEPSKEESSTDIICYQDMYLSGRLSTVVQGQKNLLGFRRDAADVIGEPNEILNDPEDVLDIIPGHIQQMYCKNRDFRIKVLQVKGEQEFINLQEVIATIQRFSTVPIETITISREMEIADIIDYYNSFDILIAARGSHLIHGLLTAFPYTKAIIEVSTFMKNPFFHRVYSRHWMFAEYVISTGHMPHGDEKKCMFQKFEHFQAANCSYNKHSYFKRWEQSRLICPHVFSSALTCDLEVNLTLIEKHMGMLVYKSLCKPGLPLAQNLESFERSVHARSKYNDSVATLQHVHRGGSKFSNRSIAHINKNVAQISKHMAPNPPKTAMAPDPRYPKSKHFTYAYYRVLDRAYNDTVQGNVKVSEQKYYLSIIAMFKNEAAVMKEWVDHHIGHGVEHMYLVDDFSTDNCKDILQPYIASGYVSLHNAPSFHTPFRQAALYKKLFTDIYAKNESRWVAIVDLDEFIYSPVEVDIKVILRQHENLAVVGLDWVWFGSSGHIQQPASVIQSFTGRAEYDYLKYPELVAHYRVLALKNEWQKNIINVNVRVDNIDVHQVVAEGVSASLGYTGFPENPQLLLNHYSTQSKNFFLNNKGTRGDVNNWIDASARNEDWFRICDINDVVDTRLKDQNLKYKIALSA